MTPYAVKDLGDGTNALMIYDNNYPGVPREMIFDRKANTWSYEASINPSVASELYSGDANSHLSLSSLFHGHSGVEMFLLC